MRVSPPPAPPTPPRPLSRSGVGDPGPGGRARWPAAVAVHDVDLELLAAGA